MRKGHRHWTLMWGKSRCRWIRYPGNENAPSANKFLLWWFIPENWTGQKCSHGTSFLKPGLFCWNCAEHSWLSPCLRKRAWGKPPVLLADLFQDRRNMVCMSLWPPSRCTWWICPKAGDAGALQLPDKADGLWGAFHWEAAAGSGELLASWKLLSFKKKPEKNFCSIWIKTKFYIYNIYVFKTLHSQGTGNTAFQPALLDSFIGLCHNKSEVRRNRKALLSNNEGWGSGKGELNQRQARWVTALPAQDKILIHVPEAWWKSRGYKALHLGSPTIQNKPKCLFGKGGALSGTLAGLCGRRTPGYFSGISEQMLLASYSCRPTYGALLCHQTLPKIQSSFWQQRTGFIYYKSWSGLGSWFRKLLISCQ